MAQGCLKCLKYTMCVANFLCFVRMSQPSSAWLRDEPASIFIKQRDGVGGGSGVVQLNQQQIEYYDRLHYHTVVHQQQNILPYNSQ